MTSVTRRGKKIRKFKSTLCEKINIDIQNEESAYIYKDSQLETVVPKRKRGDRA